jgi:GntR family phosphonate transport system transcriptional regulator
MHDKSQTGTVDLSGQGREQAVTRKSGVALWRQIADQIRQAISAGTLGADGKLPPEMILSERFGVNRHTLRSAIAALVQEGVLRAEQGRGTFVESRQKLSYPISARTRFSTGLREQTRERRSILLADAIEPALSRVAEALGLAPDAPVLRLETLSEADGRPVSRATSWFDAERFPDFARVYAEDRVDHARFPAFWNRGLFPQVDTGFGAPCRCRRPDRSQAVRRRHRTRRQGDQRRHRRRVGPVR